MAQYFVALFFLCVPSSLATTTKPQQQITNTLKDLCQKSVMSHGFPGIPGSNGMPGMPGAPGPQGIQGREGAKGQTGDKGTQGMMGLKGERGRQGSNGKSGPRGMTGMKGERGPAGPSGMNGSQGMMGIKGDRGHAGTYGMKGSQGMMGMKGERGFVGAAGRKGDKGEKGESVKGRPAGPVPQTNWKQCVWKKDDGTDNGKIKDCSFNKLQSDTALKVSFQGNMIVEGTSTKCNRWYFKFNNQECSGPMTIEAVVYNYWPSGSPSPLHHRSFEGYCTNIPQGTVRVELWVGQCIGQTLGNADTGWNSVSRIMIEEVSRAQS